MYTENPYVLTWDAAVVVVSSRVYGSELQMRSSTTRGASLQLVLLNIMDKKMIDEVNRTRFTIIRFSISNFRNIKTIVKTLFLNHF